MEKRNLQFQTVAVISGRKYSTAGAAAEVMAVSFAHLTLGNLHDKDHPDYTERERIRAILNKHEQTDAEYKYASTIWQDIYTAHNDKISKLIEKATIRYYKYLVNQGLKA